MDFGDMLDQIISSTDPKRKERIKAHYCSLLAIADADNKLHPREIELLTELANKWELSEKEIEELWNNPIPPIPPDSYKDRVEFLLELAMMMMVDGNMDERELKFCRIVAEKYGLDPDMMNFITWQLIEFLEGHDESPNSYEELLDFLYQELKKEFNQY